MVAYNKGQKTDRQNLAVAGLVCPQCFKSLAGSEAIAVSTEDDRYGRRLRRYFAFCVGCNKRFEVVQLEREGRWFIHKYQSYTTVEGRAMPAGDWVQLNGLPEPAPVVTGPGGDYDKQIEPKPEAMLKTKTMALLATLRKGLEGLCQAIECLMKDQGMKE